MATLNNNTMEKTKEEWLTNEVKKANMEKETINCELCSKPIDGEYHISDECVGEINEDKDE